MDARNVGAVAELTGVSVRTLHHHDHVGLVVPSVRTAAGYRGHSARSRLTAEEQVEIFGTTAFDDVEPGLAQFVHDVVVASILS